MAGITFEEGLNGIEATEACLSYPFVTNVANQINMVNQMKEANFYPGGMNISDARSLLEGVDADVEATNYYYKVDPSKKTLMEEILTDMDQFNTDKTGIDPSILQTAIDTYNNNLELAQKTYYYNYLTGLATEYNDSGDRRYLRAVYVVNTKTGEYWRESEYPFFTHSITLGENQAFGSKEYDTISIPAASGDVAGLDSANAQLKSDLDLRGIGYMTIPERPSE